MAKKKKGRKANGQFVKGGAKRAKAKANPARRRRRKKATTATPRANPPRRRRASKRRRKAGTKLMVVRANPPRRRRARRNPPIEVVKATLAPAGAALAGGALCAAASAVFGRLVNDESVAAVARIALPVIAGLAATQVAHPQAQAFAAGCLGVAGVGVAAAISDAMHNANPPEGFVFDNPPALRFAAERLLQPDGSAILRPAWTDPFRVAAG